MIAPAMTTPRKRASTGLLCALLFLSGAAGLSYELVWTRLLGRYFGHSVHAVTTVLAAFMAGLALGSALFGARADRTSRPLRMYALLELGIGASCLAAPLLLDLARSIYVALHPALSDDLLLRTLLQFGLALLVLLVPATLMGGTLPAVLRAVAERAERVPNDVALLYGTNTIGAAVGAAIAGYLLLPGVGIAATNLIGVAINFAIGVFVLTRLREANAPAPRPDPTPAHRSPREAVLLFGLFASGAVAMAYQIVWTRSLILVIGSSTYAFGTILITFLFGLAAGSYAFARMRAGASVGFFAFLQVAIALSAFLLVPFFDFLPQLFLRLFAGYEGSFAFVLLTQFAVVGPFVFVPTLFLGMVLPCAVGVLSSDVQRVGASVGRLYACNTLGAIVGSILTGFWLIPTIGAQRTLSIAIALNLLIAASVLIASRSKQRVVFACLLVVAALLPFVVPAWDRVRMSYGVSIYPRGYGSESHEGNGSAQAAAPFEVLFFREGLSTTVAVTTTPDGGKSLRVNGKVDASTQAVDMLTQARLAYIPMLLHPEPKKVAIVGLGSGVTAGTAALFDSVQAIDVIELEPAVVEAAELFSEHNFAVLHNSKVAIHVDDARSFLELERGRYDVVISEPSNPWIAGVAALFSAEFMTLVHDKLAPQGVFCQWLQLYSISPDEMKLVVRTFLSAFDDASLWRASPTDYVLIGRKQGSGRVSAEAIRQKLASTPQLSALIARYGELPIESLWSSFRVDGPALKAYAGQGPLNTQDLPHLEFSAPRSLYVDHGADIDGAIASLKSRIFPDFITVEAAQAAAAPLQLGQYLLLHTRQPREAAWFLERAPALSTLASPDAQAELPMWQQASRPGARVLENFDSSPRLPLVPRVPSVRAADAGEDAGALLAGYELLMSRSSGIAPQMGLGGSNGLVLRALPNTDFVAFTIPHAVEPSTRYRLTWSMKAGQLNAETAAVVVEQFDAADATYGQFQRAFSQAHSLQHETVATLSSAQPWTRHEAAFATTPRTRMIHLILYRQGQPGREPVQVDDIVLEALGAQGR